MGKTYRRELTSKEKVERSKKQQSNKPSSFKKDKNYNPLKGYNNY